MNTQYDSRTADKFVVRLPDGLRADIDRAAGECDTSMNTVFIRAVRQYLDTQQRQKLLLDALSLAVTRKVPPCVEQLQRDLTVADERNDLAIDLLRRARAVIDGGGWADLERDIAKFFKPAEVSGSTCNQIREESGLLINRPCKACNGGACIDR